MFSFKNHAKYSLKKFTHSKKTEIINSKKFIPSKNQNLFILRNSFLQKIRNYSLIIYSFKLKSNVWPRATWRRDEKYKVWCKEVLRFNLYLDLKQMACGCFDQLWIGPSSNLGEANIFGPNLRKMTDDTFEEICICVEEKSDRWQITDDASESLACRCASPR